MAVVIDREEDPQRRETLGKQGFDCLFEIINKNTADILIDTGIETECLEMPVENHWEHSVPINRSLK